MLVKLKISEKRGGIYHLIVFEKKIRKSKGKCVSVDTTTRHNKISMREQSLVVRSAGGVI